MTSDGWYILGFILVLMLFFRRLFLFALLFLVGIRAFTPGISPETAKLRVRPSTVKVSFYTLDGLPMAGGGVFDSTRLIAAHRNLPFKSKVLLYNHYGSVTVKITDRGPWIKGREFDISPAAFKKLAPLSHGVVDVYAKIVELPSKKSTKSAIS